MKNTEKINADLLMIAKKMVDIFEAEKECLSFYKAHLELIKSVIKQAEED